MTDKFDTYDLLGILVPGTLIVGWLPFCFPSVTMPGVYPSFPQAFNVLLLTAVSVFAGQLVQAIASLVEPLLYRTWSGRPSDKALSEGLKGFLSAKTASRIKQKLKDDTAKDCEEHDLFLYAMQLSEGQDLGRTRRFNSLYAYHRALLVLLVVCTITLAASMIWGAAATWSWEQKISTAIGAVGLLSLVWHRAWQRACYYVREVLLTAERVIDDRQRMKE